ncbi:hypothetical protein [Tatumella morbirosei]|uniref:hypothetical protein n=1 Tax=Tatumella morbirosei TaxID=642227 RepID=UPI000A6F4B33|nr:hypothetical protein [Tatumella morbirosei]
MLINPVRLPCIEPDDRGRSKTIATGYLQQPPCPSALITRQCGSQRKTLRLLQTITSD